MLRSLCSENIACGENLRPPEVMEFFTSIQVWATMCGGFRGRKTKPMEDNNIAIARPESDVLLLFIPSWQVS